MRRPPNPPCDALPSLVVMIYVAMIILGIDTCGNVSVLHAFMLAGAAGHQVVWGVAHALHTPLMAVTNSISGLTGLGGIEITNYMYPKAFPDSGGDVNDIIECIFAIACPATHKTANMVCKFGIIGVLTGVGTTIIRIAAVGDPARHEEPSGWSSTVMMAVYVCVALGGSLGLVCWFQCHCHAVPFACWPGSHDNISCSILQNISVRTKCGEHVCAS